MDADNVAVPVAFDHPRSIRTCERVFGKRLQVLRRKQVFKRSQREIYGDSGGAPEHRAIMRSMWRNMKAKAQLENEPKPVTTDAAPDPQRS